MDKESLKVVKNEPYSAAYCEEDIRCEDHAFTAINIAQFSVLSNKSEFDTTDAARTVVPSMSEN